MIDKDGKTKYPYLFLGTYQMGNKAEAKQLLMSALEQGIRGFDTAPSYGTEQLLGETIQIGMKELAIERHQIKISDKIDAWQMQAYEDKIDVVIKEQLQKMQLDYIDLLLIHWPFQKYFDKVWAGMLNMKQKKLINHIGVCNVNVRVFHELFEHKSEDEQPDVIQIERHPYNTCIDMIELAKESNVVIQAYSPICRMKFDESDKVILSEIGQKYGKTLGQIILRWHLDTGVIPIVKTNNLNRIPENQNILDFRLSQDEIVRINALNRNYKLFPESWGCPGF